MTSRGGRVGVDIGGTFTDVALEFAGRRFTHKVLTTGQAPTLGVIECLRSVLDQAGLQPSQVEIIVHGTTLATNLLIERKGARTALMTTDGFRDTIEMRTEGRYDQYDIRIENPQPLVPRYLRLPVRERIAADGRVLLSLNEADLLAHIRTLEDEGVQSLAIGFLHSYTNGEHEKRAADLLRRHVPDLPMSLSSEVSPEMREFERFTTTCANAYLQPSIEGYLRRLDGELKMVGFDCPLFLMHSGGGFTTIETAARFPVRLVESGPAGGVVFSTSISRQYGLDRALSFDMGGTTAKICLIDDALPQTTRIFEAARVYRFRKGSGLPIRIPMIEMVEIGTGGGSIAALDRLGKVKVGPESAGSDPGPACYGRGGTRATVTDADLLLGRINPSLFSGGGISLDKARSRRALKADIGRPLKVQADIAAFAATEMADEDMANASRVHAIERGKEIGERTLIAFGGAAPLHAGRIAEKLGIDRVIVPVAAGVGSAVGFLQAPVTYEIVRTAYQRLRNLEIGPINAMLAAMSAEARAVVARAGRDLPVEERWLAFMRYVGQGYEIAVPVPRRTLVADDWQGLMSAFEEEYRRHYSWVVPEVDVEVLSWTVLVTAREPDASSDVKLEAGDSYRPTAGAVRPVFDPGKGAFVDFSVFGRGVLTAGATIDGPALIEEAQTTTVVPPAFTASIDPLGTILLKRRPANGAST